MISTNELTFKYRKQENLFSDLNINLKNGSITGLLGKNGAGKSTLLKIIAGLLNPQKGDLKVDNCIPAKRHPNYLANIYFVPEEFSFPPVSINVFIRSSASLYPNFDHEKFNNIMSEFELVGNKQLNKISHGQRKKFLIAFALSTNCKLLLLDEPTNGLDIPSKSLFRKVLVSSVTDEQLVIISTHQVKDVENVIDQIVLLDEGKLIFQHDTDKITEKYQFKTLSSIESTKDLIYHEKCLGGYRTITKANNEEETEIDIELLFNAIINKAQLNFTDHGA
ncbi:MAG: ABC transporter ATP-binding protein [Bacteroidota bacterium]